MWKLILNIKNQKKMDILDDMMNRNQNKEPGKLGMKSKSPHKSHFELMSKIDMSGNPNHSVQKPSINYSIRDMNYSQFGLSQRSHNHSINVSTSKSIKKSASPNSLGLILSEEEGNSQMQPLPQIPQQQNPTLEKAIGKSDEKQRKLEHQISQLKAKNSSLEASVNSLSGQLQEQKHKLNQLMIQIQLVQAEKKKLITIHQQQLQAKEQIYKWEKEQIVSTYETQIQTLKKTFKFQEQSMSKLLQEKISFPQVSIPRPSPQFDEQKEKILQQKMQELVKLQDKMKLQTQQHKNQLERMKGVYRTQWLKKQKEINEQKQKQQKKWFQQELKYEQKYQKILIEKKQLQIREKCLEKEKEQNRKLTQKIMQTYQEKISETHHEKQKALHLQHQLLEKIRIVDCLKLSKQNIIKKESKVPSPKESVKIEKLSIKIPAVEQVSFGQKQRENVEKYLQKLQNKRIANRVK